MAKLIEVEERDINYIFGKPKTYSLDVYQRDYRWSDEKEYKIVTQLLNKEIKQYFKAYEPDEDGLLTRNAINERQKLLFRVIAKIYANQTAI